MDSSRTPRVLSVLVGDDDSAIRECVVEMLVRQGFDVHTANTGDAAFRTLLQCSIDFSILDVEMPGMTGLQVVEAYVSGPWIVGSAGRSARRSRREMPTIFMSGNPAREIRDACETLGSTFLDKPFAVDDMRSAVNRILAAHPF